MTSERSIFQDTVHRASKGGATSPPIIVCSEEHRFLAAEQLMETEIPPKSIILEPCARNTAPALAAAAMSLLAEDKDALMLVLPADHLVQSASAFAQAVELARNVAMKGFLVTFGIVPSRPEPGYGYIERAARIEACSGYRVKRFVEKPDFSVAAELISRGFLWNSGMFVMAAKLYLEELGRFKPGVLAAVTSSWNKCSKDRDFCRLDAETFAACPAESIDYAVMERTEHAAVVPADMGWSDIGSWTTLWETAAQDAAGNVVRGDVDVHSTHNSYLRAESRLLSVIGMDDVVVVETSDAVLVTSKREAQSVKDVVSRLDQSKRTEHLNHRRVYRPWGYYESIDTGDRFQVKRLMVKPCEALSLQLHKQRAEHWVVVSGKAKVTCGDNVAILNRNESTYIPVGVKHRLENPTNEPLYLIEVQSGDYLGEDDIVRFEDKYMRS